jgi:hypothetical protein
MKNEMIDEILMKILYMYISFRILKFLLNSGQVKILNF